jgi:signal peptidase I
MKIVKGYPPNIEEIKKKFVTGKGTIYTYGEIIYVPSGKSPVENVKVHERVHQKQQGNDPAGWWKKYLLNGEFRLNQEVEAYRKQFKFFIEKNHSLQEQMKFLDHISFILSSALYGNIVDYKKAVELIKN